MSNPVILYTNLFTIKDKPIKTNKYIDMYYVWLFNIIKYAKLRPDDWCVTFIDKDTYEFIHKSQIFMWLASKIPNFRVLLFEPPVHIKEGMLQRYKIDDILSISSSEDSYYLYLDIDVLIVNNIHNLFENNIKTNKTTIYLKTEDKLINNNYYGELMTEEDKDILNNIGLLNMPGFTSGIFGWNNCKYIRTFFNFILEKSLNDNKKLYTVDQPFFNAAIFNYSFKEQGIFNIILLDNEITGHNRFSIEVSDKTILLNFCGIPGDDEFHWNKILLELMVSSL